MLKAVIVDNEIPVLNLLKRFLEKTGQVEISGTFTKPSEALEQIPGIKPHVAFLDIEMPGMDGLELASRLMERDDELMVVFVTGYNQYALEAFQVNALDYLLKPVNPSTIQKCVSRLIKLKGEDREKKSGNSDKSIRCFGDFEVYGSNGSVGFATRKVEEMLAYFILHRDSNIEGWQLGESLWPDEEPEKIRTNLHTTLCRLRKTIREEGLPIEISSKKGGKGIYRCSLGQIFCDLAEFEGTVRNAEVHGKRNMDALERACVLYRQDLFAERDYNWCEGKKEWLKQCFLRVLRNMAVFYLKEGRYQAAIGKLLAAEAVMPFDEEIHRSLLIAYAAQKNRAMAIKCYEQFRQRLFDELGVEPEMETRQLFIKLFD